MAVPRLRQSASLEDARALRVSL